MEIISLLIRDKYRLSIKEIDALFRGFIDFKRLFFINWLKLSIIRINPNTADVKTNFSVIYAPMLRQ